MGGKSLRVGFGDDVFLPHSLLQILFICAKLRLDLFQGLSGSLVQGMLTGIELQHGCAQALQLLAHALDSGGGV